MKEVRVFCFIHLPQTAMEQTDPRSSHLPFTSAELKSAEGPGKALASVG